MTKKRSSIVAVVAFAALMLPMLRLIRIEKRDIKNWRSYDANIFLPEVRA